MSAVDEIEAAIDKLTDLKAASTPGPWSDGMAGTYVNGPDRIEVTGHVGGSGVAVAELDLSYGGQADASLITTLHATTYAQLAILNNEVWEMKHEKRVPYHDILTLARAINGTSS